MNCKSSPVSGEVFHLPNVSNATHNAAGQTVLRITTYAQGKWDVLDAADTGFTYVTDSRVSACA